MKKFSICTDSCVDHFASYLSRNDIPCIALRRITNGVATAEIYDSFAEFEEFYNEIRTGALPTTSLLNEFELAEFFKSVLNKTQGDIIHVSLSSGLSGTCANAVMAAEELNKTLTGRKIYVLDSLSATRGMAMTVDRLIKMREAGLSAPDALERIKQFVAHQQLWAIMGDLRHLKRGGRISGFKAAVGTLLNIKPILIVNDKGKLTIRRTIKGERKSVDFILEQMKQYGASLSEDFAEQTVYVLHSSESRLLDMLVESIKEEFPTLKLNIGMIGPVVGTHVGDGAVAIVFEGAKRLDID